MITTQTNQRNHNGIELYGIKPNRFDYKKNIECKDNPNNASNPCEYNPYDKDNLYDGNNRKIYDKKKTSSMAIVKTAIKTIIQRAFFSKTKCLKLTLNSRKECYLHIGILEANSQNLQNRWMWKKIKLNDLELADILMVIEDKKQSTSFYHKFGSRITQIWIRKNKDYLTIKIKDVSKSLSLQEQVVLDALIKNIIVQINMIK